MPLVYFIYPYLCLSFKFIYTSTRDEFFSITLVYLWTYVCVCVCIVFTVGIFWECEWVCGCVCRQTALIWFLDEKMSSMSINQKSKSKDREKNVKKNNLTTKIQKDLQTDRIAYCWHIRWQSIELRKRDFLKCVRTITSSPNPLSTLKHRGINTEFMLAT